MKDDVKNSADQLDLRGRFNAPQHSILTVDVERYQEYLDDTDMTDAQKAEFLQAVWSMVVTFVEMGFGVHPVQEVCGKDRQIEAERAKEDFDTVRLE